MASLKIAVDNESVAPGNKEIARGMFDCFLGVCNAATTVDNPTNTKFVELVQKVFGSEGGAGTVLMRWSLL
jgi:hypothetical protein